MKVLWKREGKEQKPQEVKTITFYELGEDFLWIEAKLQNGQKIQSGCFKAVD